jgi:hypothetical protein
VLLISAAPFVLLYPLVIVDSFRRKELRAWATFAIVVVGFFTLVQTRLPHYIAPAYPALAVLTAVFLSNYLRFLQRKTRQSSASFWTKVVAIATVICILSALLTTGPRRTLHQAKVGPDVVYAEKESVSLLREVFRRPQPVSGPLLVWWEGNSRSIATSIFYSQRQVQQIQLQPTSVGGEINRYLYQPETLEVATSSGRRIILLDRYLVSQIPDQFTYTRIVAGQSMEIGYIGRR